MGQDSAGMSAVPVVADGINPKADITLRMSANWLSANVAVECTGYVHTVIWSRQSFDR